MFSLCSPFARNYIRLHDMFNAVPFYIINLVEKLQKVLNIPKKQITKKEYAYFRK